MFEARAVWRFGADKLLTSGSSVSNIRADILSSVESNRNARPGVALALDSRADSQAFVKASTLVDNTTSNCLPVSSIPIPKAVVRPTEISVNQLISGIPQLSASHFVSLTCTQKSRADEVNGLMYLDGYFLRGLMPNLWPTARRLCLPGGQLFRRRT
jgi:hypothetical protein